MTGDNTKRTDADNEKVLNDIVEKAFFAGIKQAADKALLLAKQPRSKLVSGDEALIVLSELLLETIKTVKTEEGKNDNKLILP